MACRFVGRSEPVQCPRNVPISAEPWRRREKATSFYLTFTGGVLRCVKLTQTNRIYWSMSNRNEIREAPNYLTANIVLFGVNLSWILLFVWAHFGLLGALFFGAAVNSAITWLQSRMH